MCLEKAFSLIEKVIPISYIFSYIFLLNFEFEAGILNLYPNLALVLEK